MGNARILKLLTTGKSIANLDCAMVMQTQNIARPGIDSPGIREFGLIHLDEHDIAQGFIEFRPFLGHCKFRDCRHQNDPGCALQNALDAGKIAPQRMQSYQLIKQSLSSD